MRGITERQKRFIAAYLECGTLTEAGRRVGIKDPYNARTRLRKRGLLPSDDWIDERIKELAEGQEAKPTTRLRALELICKLKGRMVEKHLVSVDPLLTADDQLKQLYAAEDPAPAAHDMGTLREQGNLPDSAAHPPA